MIVCPGCGVSLPGMDGQLDERYHASLACRELCAELGAYTLTVQDTTFIHQYAVDTYAAQHAGPMLKPITLTFALVGLYLACEHGYTGREVQRAHMLLVKTPKQWPVWQVPEERAALTVLDVVRVKEEERWDMLWQWEQAVWGIWSKEHARIAQLVRERLGV